jgi:hypothetical protein
VEEVSSRAVKQPHRTDWYFTFKDLGTPLKTGEARIALYVTGDQVTSSYPHLFIPEGWLRNARNEKTAIHLLNTVYSVVLALFLMGLVFKICFFNRWREQYHEDTDWNYECCCGLLNCYRGSPWWICNIKHLSFKVLNNFSHFLWRHYFCVNLASRQFSRLSVLYSAGSLSLPQSVRDMIQTALNGPTGSVSGCVLSAVKSWTFYDSWQTLLGISFGMCALTLVYEFLDIFYWGKESRLSKDGKEKDEPWKSLGGSYSPQSTLPMNERLSDLALRFFTNNHYSFEHSFASLTIMSSMPSFPTPSRARYVQTVRAQQGILFHPTAATFMRLSNHAAAPLQSFPGSTL